MKYKTEILANIDAAKAALEAGFFDICYGQTKLARDWLDREISEQEEPHDEMMAEILSIFDHPMYHKQEAE